MNEKILKKKGEIFNNQALNEKNGMFFWQKGIKCYLE